MSSVGPCLDNIIECFFFKKNGNEKTNQIENNNTTEILLILKLVNSSFSVFS